MPKILIAGGGSGGHVAPAIAVAEVLQERNHEIIIGHSGRRIDLKMIKGTGYKETALNASPLQFSPKGLLEFCKNFKLAVQRTRDCIQKENIQTSRESDLPDANPQNPNQTLQKQKAQPIRTEKKIERNSPCPCGSGKKYKKCHGK